MKIFVVRFVVLLLCCSCAASQKSKKNFVLKEIEVLNRDLLAHAIPEFDSLAQSCRLYQSDMFYAIHTYQQMGNHTLSISAIPDKDVIIREYSEGQAFPFGYFKYKNHIIIVIGDKWDFVFKITDQAKRFRIKDYKGFSFLDGEFTAYYSYSDVFNDFRLIKTE